jgi:hypothetical protein
MYINVHEVPHFPWNIRLHGRGYIRYIFSRRYGRSETCPLHMWQQQMGTGTAAHFTADDTGRDEVMSEHVPLPTGGIGRMPLVPLQSGRASLSAYRIRQSVVFSPRASCRELSVSSCRCVVLLWLCTPALFLLPAASNLWGHSPQQAGHGAGT